MEGTESCTGRFVAERSNSWISLSRYDEVFCDYDHSEEQAVKSLIAVPTGYLVEWKGAELLELLIKDFPTNQCAVVDNDHGLVCKLIDIKKIPISRWINKPNLVD